MATHWGCQGARFSNVSAVCHFFFKLPAEAATRVFDAISACAGRGGAIRIPSSYMGCLCIRVYVPPKPRSARKMQARRHVIDVLHSWVAAILGHDPLRFMLYPRH